MRALVRTVLLGGCCEFLPLTRRRFGLGFCLWLALVVTIKQQLLLYLPVSHAYQLVNEYAVLALAVHLVGRFVNGRMAVMHAGVPGRYPGMPWLRFFGLPDKAARYYGEPLLVLAVAVWAAQSVVFLRFRPLFRFDVLPLPYGVAGVPFPLWYRQHAVLVAHLLPVVSALCLALFNRLAARKPTKNAPPKDKPLIFTDVQQLAPTAALPVPSAAWLAMALQHERKTP